MEAIKTLSAEVMRIACELNADAILVFTDTGRTYELVRKAAGSKNPKVIAATPNPITCERLKSEGGLSVLVPGRIASRIGQIQRAISRAVEEGIISSGELLVCLAGAKPGTDADTIFIHRVTGSESKVARLVESNPVVEAVAEIAIQLGRDGLDGRPVGTSFIVGDEEKVMELSYQMGINPFKGYPSFSVLDRRNWELIKKYAAAVEGAFVVDRNGVILAGDRYLRAEDVEVEINCGLGTRHRAVARTTAVTKAIGIVVSEGDRRVRIFQGGRLVGAINSSTEAELEA